MSKLFYPKLAKTNMKKNSKFYLPYILTCIFTIMMFYNMCSIASHQGLSRMPGAENIQMLMTLGSYIIGIFSVIFLFYTNNFLMRRRKKEIGLYNILGMGKRHIAKVLFFETVFTIVISLIVGLLCGMLFNRLVVMALEKIVKLPVVLETEMSLASIITTVILFVIIFLLCLISNLAKISLSKPIELLHEQNAGEREPKTKWLIALIGFASIGGGYYIALTTESPLEAIILFFVAVILVIIGTYCLFTAGSIFVLKLLRKNKRFYYKAKHFTSVSGMIYRMKQNAVGLANICILSTMVLVMVSGTISMYLGSEDAIDTMYPYDMIINRNCNYEELIKDKTSRDHELENNTLTYDNIMSEVKSSKMEVTSKMDYILLSVAARNSDGKFIFDVDNYPGSSDVNGLVFLTSDTYNNLTNQNIELADGEVLAYSSSKLLNSSFYLFEKEYTVKNRLDEFPIVSDYETYATQIHYIVLPDFDNLVKIYEGQKEAYQDKASSISYQISFDIKGSAKEKIDLYKDLKTSLDQEGVSSKIGKVYVACKEDMRDMFYRMYGGFFFLGIFLGTLFIMATVLIIYYKQISEGYEDKERFSIMQKVGMSQHEVKKSIHSQVLMVFFLPIIMAGIHVLASFKMITKLLGVLGLTNVPLFAICSVGTVIVFVIIYAFVYAMTAKTYYKIVG